MPNRNPKIDEKMIEEARKHIEAGNFAVVVARYLGICGATYYSYFNKGEEDIKNEKNTIYAKWAKMIQEAEAKAEMRNVLTIQKASQDTWQAAAWYLERKHKNRWSAKQELEHSGEIVKIIDNIPNCNNDNNNESSGDV